MILKGGKVLDCSFNLIEKDLYIDKGKIADSSSDNEVLDIKGLKVIPGLIDIHMHGFMGVDIVTADEKDLQKMSDELLKQGTTSYLATTNTDTKEALIKGLTAISDFISKQKEGSEALGINMEGPFLSLEYKGAMTEELIRLANKEEIDDYIKASKNNIKMMTIAPEREENFNIIPYLCKHNIIPSIGHSNATADITDKAIKEGVKNATHLFNAMRGLKHREPGVVGAVFDNDITAELICDGFHINERVLRLAFNILKERAILISDSIPHAGLPDGVYEFRGKNIYMKNGTCTLKDGTIDGDAHPIYYGLKQLVKFGIPFNRAVYAGTYAPAKRLGIEDRKGSIKVGKDADLLVIDDNMDIKYVIKEGRVI